MVYYQGVFINTIQHEIFFHNYIFTSKLALPNGK